MHDDMIFKVMLGSKRFPGGRDEILVQAGSIEEALKNVRDREGKVEENGVWIPKGAMIIGIGVSGYSGVLLKKSILTT